MLPVARGGRTPSMDAKSGSIAPRTNSARTCSRLASLRLAITACPKKFMADPSTAQIPKKQSPGVPEISYEGAVSAARFRIELILREPLSVRVHRLRFASRVPFRWLAGQYLVIVRGPQVGASARPNGEDLFLPYSFASTCDPTHPGQFEIAAAFRAGADVIDDLEIGGELEAEGPVGSFVWQATPSPAALLVGVGTGIAPLRALILEELTRPTDTRLLLVAGHRVPEDVLFHDDFRKLAETESRFQFVPTLTGDAA